MAVRDWMRMPRDLHLNPKLSRIPQYRLGGVLYTSDLVWIDLLYGEKKHLFVDCQTIRHVPRGGIDAVEPQFRAKKKSEICKICLRRFEREYGITPEDDIE